MTLAHLSRHASMASIFESARSSPPRAILPNAFDQPDGVRVICYPGDELHSVPDCVMPGPTRLLFRNKRFEPEAGFDAWFQ
jgi:hypothetical protein